MFNGNYDAKPAGRAEYKALQEISEVQETQETEGPLGGAIAMGEVVPGEAVKKWFRFL